MRLTYRDRELIEDAVATLTTIRQFGYALTSTERDERLARVAKALESILLLDAMARIRAAQARDERAHNRMLAESAAQLARKTTAALHKRCSTRQQDTSERNRIPKLDRILDSITDDVLDQEN